MKKKSNHFILNSNIKKSYCIGTTPLLNLCASKLLPKSDTIYYLIDENNNFEVSSHEKKFAKELVDFFLTK